MLKSSIIKTGENMNDISDNETVKEEMAAGLKKCMAKTSIENVTVREICDRSGFSRQTFYRHFLDKYDLLNWYFDKLLHRSFKEMGSGETVYAGLVRKFTFIKQEKVMFENAFRMDEQNSLRSHDYEMIYAFYRDLIKEKTGSLPDESISWLLEMYCRGSVSMTVNWVLSGMKTSVEKLAKLMVQAMPVQLAELFRKINVLEGEQTA